MNKHHKLLIAWFIISGLIVFTAVRQIQVAAASQNQARQPLPPPVKTRHAIRPAVLPWSGDPVADYVARCEKGMTDREIRWVIEDFQSALLDQFPITDSATDKILVAYRANQKRWYHNSLVDGLRLTREQSAQAAKKLGEMLKNTEIDFREKPISGNKNTPSILRSELGLLPGPWSFGAYGYGAASKMSKAPWDLCQLSTSQERLTWKGWFDHFFDTTETKDYETRLEDARRHIAERKGEPLFWSPDLFSTDNRNQTVPHGIADANSILPLLANQKILSSPELEDPFAEPVNDGGVSLLANIRLLHRAQFKLVLLFHPELAGEIEGVLEKSSH